MNHQKYWQQLTGLVLIFLLLAACGPVSPQPGAQLDGTITMDKAESARISLTVSKDGLAIESVSVSFTEIKCEGFSAGSTSTTITSISPITDGGFEFISSDLGEITGKFTSPNAARGTFHLVFFNGGVDCGTWEWSAGGEK
jgi:hypothetical protein